MITKLRIPRYLRDQMWEDLLRPHRFAAERVGFARLATGTLKNGSLLLLKSYWPVTDEQYVDDSYVGARINSTAIQAALQDILTGGHGLLHVHFHNLKGRVRLSKTDIAEIPKLVTSFRNVAPKVSHGFLVLSRDHAMAFALSPGNNSLVPVTPISVVGYPTEIFS